MRKQKGSFTIEAIIWIPLMLCLMLYAIEEGISFYTESITSENVQELESWTGSKLGTAYLTYMRSTSCEMPDWIKHKLESRLPGEIPMTPNSQMT